MTSASVRGTPRTSAAAAVYASAQAFHSPRAPKCRARSRPVSARCAATAEAAEAWSAGGAAVELLGATLEMRYAELFRRVLACRAGRRELSADDRKHLELACDLCGLADRFRALFNGVSSKAARK